MSTASLLKEISRHKKFLICTHVNPDPDALASQVAMAICLEKLGKKVTLVAEDKVPERFLFLPGMRRINALDAKRKVDYDAVIVTDAGDLDRIGDVKKILLKDKPVINIDHHITNTNFGTINHVLPNVSSTCEVVYGILKACKVSLDKDLAMLLYVGVMTDTGSFRYSNTSSKTHRMVSELLEFPIDANKIYQQIYEQVPLSDIKYFTQVIAGFSSLNDGKLICINLSKKIVKKFSEQFDLRDKIFGYLRTIQGVEVLVIFTEEKSNVTRVNFRSQGSVNVADIAAKFSGGGHSKASGCVFESDIKYAYRKVLPEIKKQLK